MKFKVQSSKYEDGEFIVDVRVVRTLNFELRTSTSRRGSVLVLVMTILGILFVLGIAFLASMNFEADLIASETQRNRAESRVTAVVDQLGSTLRDGLMSAARTPFGDPSTALSPTAFAEMPGVQNSTSAIEPHWEPGPDGILGNADDKLVFSPYTDVAALKRHPFTGPLLVDDPRYAIVATNALKEDPFTGPPAPQGFAIDTSLPNGAMMAALPNGKNIKLCLGGVNIGKFCDVPNDCPGGVCEGPRVLDADGDGIADSLQVDATALDFSDAQLAALSARLNPPTNPTGKVFVGIRVIPHGGLVNLNASHAKLIDNVFDLPLNLPDPPDFLARPPDPEYGYFYHRPTQNQVAYSPLLEESTLRRRVLLPPRDMPPSWLQGDPFRTTDTYNRGNNAGGADIAWQLFHPVPGGRYESVSAHRSSPFDPSHDPADPNAEFYTRANTDLGTLWDVRMEPFSSAIADPTGREYDRRHLVTTVSHDDLLARGGRVPNPAVPGGEEDILTKMTQANQTAWDPEVCPSWMSSEFSNYVQFLENLRSVPPAALLPFEYIDYPQTIPNDCCTTDMECRLNARKGRLQLSLPWLDDQFAAANKLTDPTARQRAQDRLVRLIHDTFFLLVRNAAHVTTLEGTPCASDVDCAYANGKCGGNHLCTVATVPPAPAITFTDCRAPTPNPCSIPGSVCRATDGVCTIQAPYWQDVQCPANPCNVAAGEVCDPAIGLCVDAWTGQTHSQALISRTAAALTANLIDYADADDIPTRIALRSLDLTAGLCIAPPASVGRACDMDADCGSGGTCSPPRGMCAQGANTGRVCGSDAACGNGGQCLPPAKAAGREFDFDPAATTRFEYVYGLERQPYITEVATFSKQPAQQSDPVTIAAWAVEIFNPYDVDIDATDQYYLYEVDPAAGIAGAHEIPLTGALRAGARPFTTFASGDLAGLAINGTPVDLTGGNKLSFKNDWTVYLVRRYTYPGDSVATNIVVDQFHVKGGNIGKEGFSPPVVHGLFSAQRMVKPESPWTATVPKADEVPGASLGEWNTYAPAPPPHPVEVNFANLNRFSRPLTNSSDPVSFPTTGSLLMLMRHANRSFPLPGEPSVKELAFTTALVGVTNTVDSRFAALAIHEEEQIDNGRMPIFDIGARSATPTDPQFYAAHHVSPSATHVGAPGNLDTLPWGQLVFDYFTALPQSDPGPYFVGPGFEPAAPYSLPKVDMEGLRVHGRININAAPWKVLAGLPFIPMEKVPVPFKSRIRKTLGLVNKSAPDPPAPADFIVNDADAGTIGEQLAQGIVAYRELRPIGGSGNYADGTPTVTPPGAGSAPIPYARGWNPTTPAPPPLPPVPIPLMARRGTGFMTVGELANVRHLGIADPLYRIDSGVIGVDPNNANIENFVDAVAALVALGDWVTVRSQVFTVYGVLRGEEDQTIVDLTDPVRQQKLRTQDVDSRALRFQETIDRLPTFLGEPMPSRIGDRTLTRYTDAHND